MQILTELARLTDRVSNLEHHRRAQQAELATRDNARWDWYADSCPCGVEPGECRIHHRARDKQRPPAGNWRTWAYIAGRGTGKTASAAHWIQHRVETGVAKNILLIAPTAADIRDVVVDGPSGLLAIAPPWCMPKFEPSKRRVVWPNGARAVCISGEEPDRARGLNVDTIWADELACWARAQQTWDLARLALRAGTDPRALVSTTPKRLPALVKILAEPTTVKTTESTYANRLHLAPEFVDQIVAIYEGTRLGEQEIHARVLEISDAAWFTRFSVTKHVSTSAEYSANYPVHLGIDCGVSLTVGGVFFQVEQLDQYRHRVTVFGEYCGEGRYSAENAQMIQDVANRLPSRGHIDRIRLDPAAVARSGLGPAAWGEFEHVFGARRMDRCARHSVVDALDFMDCLLDGGNLLIHPRCTKLIEAFQNYRRKERGGILLNEEASDQSPHEDMMDALRYGIRSEFPEGRAPQPQFNRVHAARL